MELTILAIGRGEIKESKLGRAKVSMASTNMTRQITPDARRSTFLPVNAKTRQAFPVTKAMIAETRRNLLGKKLMCSR